MGRIKPFTLEERKQIEEGLKLGYTKKAIANVLKRNPSSVVAEVRRCAGGYNAMEAHAQIKLGHGNYARLSARVRNLEYQMELLLEQFKGINNG